MHITGIVENDYTQKTVETMKYLLRAENKKMSVIEYGNRFKNRKIWRDYWDALAQIETEILLVRIKATDFEGAFQALHFDTLIVSDYAQWKIISSKIRKISKNSMNQMILILNSDLIKPSNFSDEEKYRLLCYGFNSDSNVTTSSTGEPSFSGKYLCCIRKGIVSANGKAVEPQEFVVDLENMEDDPYSILAAASFAVLHGVDLNKVNERQ